MNSAGAQFGATLLARQKQTSETRRAPGGRAAAINKTA